MSTLHGGETAIKKTLRAAEPVLLNLGLGTVVANLATGLVLALLGVLSNKVSAAGATTVFGAVNVAVVGGLAQFTRGRVTPNETVNRLVDNALADGREAALADLKTLAAPLATAAGIDPKDLVDEFLKRLGAALTAAPGGALAFDATP